MEVTVGQLADALARREIEITQETGHCVGSVADPDYLASALLLEISGMPQDTSSDGLRLTAAPDPELSAMPTNREEAGQALSASVWQRQKWGEGGSKDELRGAAWELERAKVHALFDVADAIREQTAEIHAQTGVMLNEGITVHEGGMEPRA
jgi:hypothetical protein